MTTQEKIKHFEDALKYFSWWNEVRGKILWIGICNYLRITKGLSYEERKLLSFHWIKYRTTNTYDLLHFKNHKERRKALRQVIKDLKKEL